MKFIERIIYIITIVLLVLYSIQKPKKSIKYETIPGDSIIDTVKVKYDSLIYKYIDIYNTDTLWLHDTTFLPTDTAAILADYFRMVSYDSINLKNDSSITAWVKINITQNRIYDINGYFLNNRSTSIIVEDKNKFGIGLSIGKNIIIPNASYQFNNHEVGLGYEINTKAPVFSYKYKFSKVCLQHLMN